MKNRPSIQSYLYVEWGNPYKPGQILPLNGTEIKIGRPSPPDPTPNIVFTSQRVSRKHAVIEYDGKKYTVSDSESSGGTSINGNPLQIGVKYHLRHGDSLGLANETVLCTFCSGIDPGQTIVAVNQGYVANPNNSVNTIRLVFSEEKRELVIDGEKVDIVGMRFELLAFLFENKGRAVTLEKIKHRIWPTSVIPGSDESDVDNELVRKLVHELRKVLKPYNNLIATKRGYGYILDEDYITKLNQSS